MMKKLLAVIMVMLFYFPAYAICATMEKEKQDIIRSISFSPDGKKILFDRRKGDEHYVINAYDLKTGELSAYQSPVGEDWHMARYSFDGKRIVFTITPRREKNYDLNKVQIAVMEPDGSNLKKITNTNGFKVDPSFSHSGKKIIYVRSASLRHEGKTPASDYDIYEVDMDTGKETRLTEFRFFMMSVPYYFLDDKKFVFSAEYPRSYPGINGNDDTAIEKIREEIKLKYKENKIFVMCGGEKVLKPYFEFYRYSANPLLSADGASFFFKGDGEPQTGRGWGQFYLYSPDGKHRRITNLKATTIWSAAVSHDGKQLAIVYDIAPQREINKIVIYQVKDGTSKEITLPDQPSRIINGK